MRRIPIEELARVGEVASSRRLTRLERLRRWADALDRYPADYLRPLRRVEYCGRAERAQLRGDHSPLAIAYADPILRSEGMASDRMGEGIRFFGLSDRDLHALVCDCHYGRRARAADVARRIRGLGDPNPLVRLWTRITL